MKESGDRVFLIRQKQISMVPSRSLRDGLLGKSLEDALQSLFEDYPEILPGHQIAAGNDDPPTFVLLRREMPVGGSWSLDHLYADQHGVLTLVETKLSQNPESRREVIGQIIEYAANAQNSWNSAVIREKASLYWQSRGEALENVLENAFGPDFDVEGFWTLVDSELKRNNLRLIIAADQIRPEVRRMIEYLNAEMKNTEVLGLELRCYADDSESVILAPQLIGQTSQTVDRKSESRKNVSWNEARLKEVFSEVEPNARSERLTTVLNWAVATGVELFSPSVHPAFGIRGKSGPRIMSLYATGEIYAIFDAQSYNSAPEDRDTLIQELLRLEMMKPGTDFEGIKSGRTCLRRIDELTDKEFDGFCDLVARLSGATRAR